MSDEWSIVTFRIVSGVVVLEELERALGAKTRAKRNAIWTTRFGGDESTLREQLSSAAQFLMTHVDYLASLRPEAEMNLHVGWTPRSPQDGVVFDEKLVKLLGSIGAYILLDTYLE